MQGGVFLGLLQRKEYGRAVKPQRGQEDHQAQNSQGGQAFCAQDAEQSRLLFLQRYPTHALAPFRMTVGPLLEVLRAHQGSVGLNPGQMGVGGVPFQELSPFGGPHHQGALGVQLRVNGERAVGLKETALQLRFQVQQIVYLQIGVGGQPDFQCGPVPTAFQAQGGGHAGAQHEGGGFWGPGPVGGVFRMHQRQRHHALVQSVAQQYLAFHHGDQVRVAGQDGGPGAPQARHGFWGKGRGGAVRFRGSGGVGRTVHVQNRLLQAVEGAEDHHHGGRSHGQAQGGGSGYPLRHARLSASAQVAPRHQQRGVDASHGLG